MIESLIRRGAIIDGIGNRTMFYAAMNSNWLNPLKIHLNSKIEYSHSDNDKVVDLMIKHGGNVNAADDRGNTLLHLAALNSRHKNCSKSFFYCSIYFFAVARWCKSCGNITQKWC